MEHQANGQHCVHLLRLFVDLCKRQYFVLVVVVDDVMTNEGGSESEVER